MDKIEAYPRTIDYLLNGVKYTVDFYQREYKWEKKHIADLIRDLETTFFTYYDEINEDQNERSDVQRYGYYFLGSIVKTRINGKIYIVDGQQRLTSLTLLFIFLKNLQNKQNRKDSVNVDNLIYSEKYGRKSFNFEDPDDRWREKCMEALYFQREFDVSDKSQTIRNIRDRYIDIEDLFPETLMEKALPFFIEWLMYNVQFVEISASTNDDAYKIFESMNDRGLSLKPVEMLKGYLLSNIRDPKSRKEVNIFWKERILKLNNLGKDEDSSFIKIWFRAKFAKTIRERKKNAIPRDYERIGSEFHKWFREQQQQERLKLKKNIGFANFITRDFEIFSKYYLIIRRASKKFNPNYESIYYNALNNFTLQYPLLLAPIKVEDDEKTIIKKIRITSKFIEIFITRRFVNKRTIRYSSIQYTIFNLIKEIRDLSLDDLSSILKQKLDEMEEDFSTFLDFKLHSQNRKLVHNLLARITYFIEKECKMETSLEKYTTREIEKPFEIEHIWGDAYDQHLDEFPTEDEFQEYRQYLGNLVLLPRGFNQSLSNNTYPYKYDAYFGHNMLAKTLCKLCYKNNPDFLRFIQETGLPFQAHKDFKKKGIQLRQILYQKISEYLWNPSLIEKIKNEA